MSDDAPDYAVLPEPPRRCDAAGVLTRLVDAIGFRYRWATDGLRPADWSFRAGEQAMSVQEVDRHLLKLLQRCCQAFGVAHDIATPDGDEQRRAQVLATVLALRAGVAARDADQLAAVEQFWNLISGPLADALTHIGQIAAWRRQAGNPAPKVNHFKGVRIGE